MSSLLTIAECRALVKTALSDADLQDVIDRIEAQITKRIGAPQDDAGAITVTETVRGNYGQLFLRVPFSAIVSITEDGALVNAAEYQAWGPSGMIERLPEHAVWGAVCAVVYKPSDMRYERKQATIDLVRLTIERTAMNSESIAGEYSFTAPDWDAAFRKIMRKLCFVEV